MRKALPRALLALVLFLAICAPWILLVSKQKGYLTYGLTGRLNYIWFNNRARPWITGMHNIDSSMPHPPQIILTDPIVYAFPRPAKGSYPFWFDPSYWSEGLTPHLQPARQLRVLTSNLHNELFDSAPVQYVLLALVLVLLFLSPRTFGRSFLREWHLWIPGLCGLMLYSLVHVENRLIAPFLFLIFTAAFSAAMRTNSQYPKLLLAVALSAFVLTAASVVTTSITRHGRDQIKSGPFDSSRSPNDNEAVANKLRQAGLKPEDRIGLVGDAYRAYWLRLARISVAAEITPAQAERFWSAEPARREAAMRAFAQAGARAIVTDQAPPSAISGWRRLGNTEAYIYPLDLNLARQ